jgi:hypothetical protein
MTDLENEIKRLQNLKNYKNKSVSELEGLARKNVFIRQLKIDDRFKNAEEKKIAIESFENYLDHHTFNTFNEATLLTNLIYEEILQRRIEKSINEISDDESNKFIPEKSINALHEVQDRVAQLKERLGISKAKDQDDLTALQMLKKKFDCYIPFNRNEFHTSCPSCGKMLLLRRRVKDFETLVSPFFAGRTWFSRRGIELVKLGIISKEIYAFLFQTSVAFVDWCIKKENTVVEIDGVEQGKIEEFIQNSPHLQKVKIPLNILEQNKGV